LFSGLVKNVDSSPLTYTINGIIAIVCCGEEKKVLKGLENAFNYFSLQLFSAFFLIL